MERDLTIRIRLEGANEVHDALAGIVAHIERVDDRVRRLYREQGPEDDPRDEFLDSLPEAQYDPHEFRG